MIALFIIWLTSSSFCMILGFIFAGDKKGTSISPGCTFPGHKEQEDDILSFNDSADEGRGRETQNVSGVQSEGMMRVFVEFFAMEYLFHGHILTKTTHTHTHIYI